MRTLTPLLVFACVASIAACGSGGASPSPGGSDASSSEGGHDGSAGDASDASHGADAADDGGSDAASDSPSDAPADVASDGDAASSGDGGSLVYSAYGLPGGYDRVLVFAADAANDLCFVVGLLSPGQGNTGGLTLPQGWDLEKAGVWHDANACTPNYGGAGTWLAASSQSGSVTWAGSGIPQQLSIDVTLSFASPPPWAPASQAMKATNVAVQ